MQTVYYTTTHFIRHEGNLVDLEEFRGKLSSSREDASLSAAQEQPASSAPLLTLLPPASRGMFSHLKGVAWALDACASLAVVIMTLSFALHLFA